MKEDINELYQITFNLDTAASNNRGYTTDVCNKMIELLAMLHKATNVPEFEKMKQDLIETRGQFGI